MKAIHLTRMTKEIRAQCVRCERWLPLDDSHFLRNNRRGDNGEHLSIYDPAPKRSGRKRNYGSRCRACQGEYGKRLKRLSKTLERISRQCRDIQHRIRYDEHLERIEFDRRGLRSELVEKIKAALKGISPHHSGKTKGLGVEMEDPSYPLEIRTFRRAKPVRSLQT